jgi:hypothetical protein
MLAYETDLAGNSLTHTNDIALLAVPEPSIWVPLLGGMGMLAFCLRRRRQESVRTGRGRVPRGVGIPGEFLLSWRLRPGKSRYQGDWPTAV